MALTTGKERSPCMALVGDTLDNDDVEAASRSEDFLNDKLQAHADFESYEALIASVEAQRAQLDAQLQVAHLKLLSAQSQKAKHLEALSEQREEFKAQQKGIDRRLAIVTASDAPDEAVEAFRAPMEKLRKLELAHLYVELLQELDNLSEQARSYIPASPKQALVPYVRLKDMSRAVTSLHKPTEGAATHLVNYVNTKTENLWQDMQKIMSDEFKDVLKEQNYPSTELEASAGFKDCFQKLLDLQEPDFTLPESSVILLPFTVMTETFRTRFKYHFLDDRPTNSKTEPELALDWVIELFNNWQENLRNQVTPLLAARFSDTKFVGNSVYVDAFSAFIAAFLPAVREKCEQFLSRTTNEPQYMSKFFQELMRFDDRLRDELKYDGGDIKYGWRGMTWDVLQSWFITWESAEKQFALKRYQELLDNPENLSIDYDSGSAGRTKTTHGAAKVMDLFNSVTLLYQPLKSFSHKIRFLIDVQLSIMDQFHGRLKDSLDAYLSMTSTVGAWTHGVSKEDQAKLEGVGGLVSLCKVYGSADHVIAELQEQSNSSFFIDLWNELQMKARGLDSDDSLAGPMTSEEVKGATSSAVGSRDEGAVFDETSNAYKGLKKDAERLIAEELRSSLPRLFKNYINKPQWQVIGSDDDDVQSLHITAELDAPLQALQERLVLLHRTLSTATFRKIWRGVSTALQDLLWYQVIMHQHFTLSGGRQFHRDQEAILSLIESYIPGASSSVLGMLKIQNAASLLRLPLTADSASVSVTQAYDRVMTDNANAKAFIEEQQFSDLDFNEARRVLARRVEVGG